MTGFDLYVLRHGQTEWNAEGRFQGALDSALTALGRAQAERQGAILAGLGIGAETHDFAVSPQGRARQTAAIALGPIGAVATVDERLREISLGAWDGLTRKDIASRRAAGPAGADASCWQDAAPGGEGFASVAARTRAFLAGLRRPTVVITHGTASLFLRGAALGLDLPAILALPERQGVVYHIRDGRERQHD